MRDNFFRNGAPVPRSYQRKIAESASLENTLVVLPTGLGKTLIAALVMQGHLVKGKKVIMLAPTRPLSEQHKKTMLELMELDKEEVVLITGTTPANKRKELWEKSVVALATPQTLENDLINGRAGLDDVGLIIFDEAHRCVGKYAYTYVARQCRESDVRILGLTASPGADERKIRGIMETLGITKVEIRGDCDEEILEYAQPVSIKWIEVELPEAMSSLRDELGWLIKERAGMFETLGLVSKSPGRLSKKRLIEIRRKIEASDGGWKYAALSRYAELFNLLHAHELLETQGIGTFLDFFERMAEREEKSRAVQRLLKDEKLMKVLEKARKIEAEHPKLEKLIELIRERPGRTFIVFVQYRDQIKRIVWALENIEGLRPVKFIGKKEGVSQREQKETIERFRAGEFNVLVATQIGEEGLDIPSVDCVIFYEPIPSEIRSIQRRGRAGRTRAGEVVILITKDTRDEAYYWVAKKKEKRMKKIIWRMQKEGDTGNVGGKKGNYLEKSEKRGYTKRAGNQTKILDYV